ncbi:unnamed protein product [Ectocarpus sp. CCAP 1310/34]|nr:unnamed protein product [Ectocarpus sp. CCAP 1310/34]
MGGSVPILVSYCLHCPGTICTTQTKRTHHTPTTPSDVGHLLPPIGGRKPRRDGSGSSLPPIPPCVEPSLPCPAPVDRNRSGLYDPALDPSPIGKEERGKVQPVRISRVVPRQDSGLGAQELQGEARSAEGLPIPTVVTVLNGYNTQHRRDRTSAPAGDYASATHVLSEDEESCIDVFVEGFSRGVDHETLLPSEMFCRALQHGSQGPPKPSSLISEDSRHYLDVREGYLGLTVFLARTSEWSGTIDGGVQGEKQDECIEPGIGDGKLAAEMAITRMIFQREDGTPAPSRNAFRVQFEPGPLGVELEEYPGDRGIVRVRRVLQAGQAELDGRLSAGCLIVAVGGWDESSANGTLRPSTASGAGTGHVVLDGVDIYGNLDVPALRSSAMDGGSGAEAHKSAIIRSLADFEEAVSCREPDRLFVLWALDRHAPEAVAALGPPQANGVCTVPRGWSPASVYSRRRNEGRGRVRGTFPSGSERQRPFEASKSPKSQGYEESEPEGALGRETTTILARSRDSLRYSLSSDRPKLASFARNQASHAAGGGQLQTGGGQPEADLAMSAFGSPKEVTGSERLAAGINRLGWPSREGKGGAPRFGEGGARNAIGWEFETGGGIFDDDDQGLAARKHPARRQATLAPAATPADEAEEKPPTFPLGLESSAVDDLAVFIWFCNNHESAVMKVEQPHEGVGNPVRGFGFCWEKEHFVLTPRDTHGVPLIQRWHVVSWIDYDGRRVPRRSLAPGACYFERSFATHPWVIQHSDSNQAGSNDRSLHAGGQQEEKCEPTGSGAPVPLKPSPPREAGDDDDAELCVVRLGDTMAVAQFTGSLIWNPTGRTLSITKQARVGVPGMSAAARAAVGAGVEEGGGLDPGMKRLCMAGQRREAEEARARAARAVVREEKARVLEEIKAWRTHPLGGGGLGAGGGVAEGLGGKLGQGVPNLRVVMMGSGWSE